MDSIHHQTEIKVWQQGTENEVGKCRGVSECSHEIEGEAAWPCISAVACSCIHYKIKREVCARAATYISLATGSVTYHRRGSV